MAKSFKSIILLKLLAFLGTVSLIFLFIVCLKRNGVVKVVLEFNGNYE
jgi:hypothetical protein